MFPHVRSTMQVGDIIFIINLSGQKFKTENYMEDKTICFCFFNKLLTTKFVAILFNKI